MEKLEQVLLQVRNVQGDVLFNRDFSRNKFQYEYLKENTAGRALTNGEMAEVKQLIEQFSDIHTKAVRAFPVLTDLLQTRKLAINKGVEDYSPQLFAEAEKEFAQLAESVAENPEQQYFSEISEIASKYHLAQFQAIKNTLLSEVKILVHESKNQKAEKYAPRSYAIVQQLLREVEDALKNNQFDDPFLLEKSDQLYIEAKQLYKISETANRIKNNDAAFEAYILEIQTNLKNLSEAVGYRPEFSEGISSVVEDLKTDISGWKERSDQLSIQSEILTDSIDTLNQRNRELLRRLNRIEAQELKVQRLSEELAADLVNITTTVNHIRISIPDIDFQPGQLGLTESHAVLIAKIGRLLQTFTVKKIKITTVLPVGGNLAYTENFARERSNYVAGLLQVSGLFPASNMDLTGKADNNPSPRLNLDFELH